MEGILIIDGHRSVRELLEEEFASEGYRVRGLGEPELPAGPGIDFTPDLVVLDPFINGMDRWDVLGSLKRRFPRSPVLIFTAYDGYRQDPRLSEADGFFVKSFCCDELKEKVADVLQRKERPVKVVKENAFLTPPSRRGKGVHKRGVSAGAFWAQGHRRPTDRSPREEKTAKGEIHDAG